MNVNTQWFAASASSRTLLRGPNVARIGVGHALIDNCSSEQVCASIIAHALDRGKPAYVITSNAQHIVQLEKERSLQEIYDHADLVIPDGISLLIAARLYGRSLQQRIAGVDIFKVLCGRQRRPICMSSCWAAGRDPRSSRRLCRAIIQAWRAAPTVLRLASSKARTD